MTDLTKSILDRDNLNHVLDNLKLGIIVHTPDRTVTLFNKEAQKITGYPKEEVIGRDWHTVFKVTFCGQKCSFCNNAEDVTSGTKEYPVNITTKDGFDRQLEMTVSAVIDKKGEFKGVIASFKEVTETFNLSLKAENLSNFAGIISRDKVMLDIFKQIRDVALYSYPVNITGDTGTGKERVAYAIHDISSYGNGAFVPVNCGAIPEGIVESELFGHVKGAFSGAVKERKGRFELANKGTLFLDEVAELSLKTQVKLLRFLEEGTFEKVGGEDKITVDVRIISATNKNLKDEVINGKFREDLYYRLNVIPIHLPPLKHRKNDIPLLAAHFLKEAEHESPNTIPKLTREALDLLLDYHWPGNVRELKNVIQFSIVRSQGGNIHSSDLPVEITRGKDLSLNAIRKGYSKGAVPARHKLTIESVKAAIKKTGGNKSKAAKLLDVGRATLYRFLAQNREVKNYSDQF